MKSCPWYILQVKSGKEKETIEEIKNSLKKHNYEKEVIKLKTFNQGSEKNKILPGYIFCQCYLTSELVNLFYDITQIIKFLNHEKKSANLPKPLSNDQVKELSELLTRRINLDFQKVQDYSFQLGDLVKIMQGKDFAGCQGKVVEINHNKKELTVEINFFGRRPTPVEIKMQECIKE